MRQSSKSQKSIDSDGFPKQAKSTNKFYGIYNKDIDYFEQNQDLSLGSKTYKKRIPGLSQEYVVKKPQKQDYFPF